MPLNVSEWESATKILVRARELVMIGPWGKPLTDTTLSPGPNVPCMAVAMESAWKEQAASIVDFDYARMAMDEAINLPELTQIEVSNDPLSVPYWGRYYMYWNDSSSRTKEEVLAAFDRAIDISQKHLEEAKSNGVSSDALLQFDLDNMRQLGLLK
jgi:hypothetical protein